MKKLLPSFLLAVALVFNQGLAHGGYASTLPKFSLEDPAGNAVNRSHLKKGAVIIVSAPTLGNKSDQEGWSDFLRDCQPKGKAKLVLVEDMSVSGFKGIALNKIKEEYEPGTSPLLIIDPDGRFRTSLGVEPKKTVILVYDAKGKLVFQTEDPPTPQAAKEIWKKL